ncbi:TetR/AcrR family transcriptional regulator [Bacterioplanoides pacificum]|uniref:TetR/AcrR family transcriptional regulator n=1 Tax=Bacterioplanoides pacificum TaxID=1171596 RepID=A0ABV7VWC7_9GAMM
MANKDTAKAILNAAEELFSEKGFAETSLRNITTKAGVNLAAVNYHFGSKKELIQAVFARFLNSFCQRLDQQVDAYQQQRGSAQPDLNAVLMMLPATALEDDKGVQDELSQRRLGIFMRLLGLAYTQGQGHVRKFLKQEYGTVFNRYMALVTAASPQLSNEERFWRIHFMLGATVFTLSGADSLMAMAQHEFGLTTDISQVFDKLIPFLGAGLQAPG